MSVVSETNSDLIDKDEIEKIAISLQSLEMTGDRVERMHTWPFDTNLIITTISTMIIPITTYIIGEMILTLLIS